MSLVSPSPEPACFSLCASAFAHCLEAFCFLKWILFHRSGAGTSHLEVKHPVASSTNCRCEMSPYATPFSILALRLSCALDFLHCFSSVHLVPPTTHPLSHKSLLLILSVLLTPCLHEPMVPPSFSPLAGASGEAELSLGILAPELRTKCHLTGGRHSGGGGNVGLCLRVVPVPTWKPSL